MTEGPVRWLGLSAVLVLVLGAYVLVPVRADPAWDVVVRAGAAGLLLAFAATLSVRQVRRSLAGDSARVDGLVVAIVVSVVAFSLVAYALEVHQPSQFSGLETRLDALYFTLATLLTVGYGDVHAAGQAARGLIVVQMLFDVVVVTATASVLTTRLRRELHRRTTRRTPTDDDPTVTGPG